MASTVIHHFTQDDVPDVANIHVKVFYGSREPASKDLQSYYRHVFLHNPWRKLGLDSLVYRDKEGKSVGFMGVVPRPMSYMGREIRVAVAHRLMVDPDNRGLLVGAKLVREFLDGPRELSIADGANNEGRRMFEALGARTFWTYSMNWFRPLRPFSYATTLLAKKKGCLGRSAFAFRPYQ